MSEQVKPCIHGRRFCMECHYQKDAPRSTLPEMYDKLQADYDALHAEAEVLDTLCQSRFDEIAQLKSEAEALRAENGHWKGMHASSMALRMSAEFERDELRTELDEARGLLREAREAHAEAIRWEDQHPVMKKIDALLIATTSPDVPDHFAEASKMV